MNPNDPLQWDPVDVTEIAERLGVSVHTVRRWRQRPVNFPPATHLATGPIWPWPIVADWARSTGRLEDPTGGSDGEP